MKNLLMMRKLRLIITLVLAAVGLCWQQARAQGLITGNITFAGSVNLDTNSVNTATEVTSNGWHGPVSSQNPSGLPQVQSRDGTFASQGVAVGDPTTFASPWPFNSGSISSFWSVDGFTFDLTSSHIVQQNGGFLAVTGTGTVSHTGFLATAGIFNFTTQDPAASSQFSFSASTAAVPEPGAFALLTVGALALGLVRVGRKNRS